MASFKVLYIHSTTFYTPEVFFPSSGIMGTSIHGRYNQSPLLICSRVVWGILLGYTD